MARLALCSSAPTEKNIRNIAAERVPITTGEKKTKKKQFPLNAAQLLTTDVTSWNHRGDGVAVGLASMEIANIVDGDLVPAAYEELPSQNMFYVRPHSNWVCLLLPACTCLCGVSMFSMFLLLLLLLWR